MSDFVHLRTHSSYSLKSGTLDPEDLVRLAAQAGQPAIALTDDSNLFDGIGFYNAARKHGVKPIMGVDAWIETDVTNPVVAPMDDQIQPQPAPTRIVLLSQNLTGYSNLLGLISRAYTDNQVKGIPMIRQSWLAAPGAVDGLFALSGDMVHGEVAQAVLDPDPASARARASAAISFYRKLFGDRYYIEIQRYNQPQEGLQVRRLVHMASSTRTPLVATHPIQFAKPQDFYEHELRVCIATNEIITDPGRLPKFTQEQYFPTSQEMAQLFSDLPIAVENAGRIASRLNTTLNLGISRLPHFETRPGEDEAQAVYRLGHEGLDARLARDFPDPIERAKVRADYGSRLDMELGVITKMGFSGYFLIVYDFIGWAKDNNISVGPGRGSGAGSLVAYALRITEVDPLVHNLLFERFLNPERVSMPDFDIDFEMDHRDAVIEYVRRKYGADCVAQIATFGTLGARGSLKAVARAFGVVPQTMQVLSNLIPTKPVGIGLKQALFGDEAAGIRRSEELYRRYESEGEIRKIVDLAISLEGLPTSVGKHAGGVVIAAGKLTDFSPLYYDPSSSGAAGVITQFDHDAAEEAGLVKFDFLGLETLTIIDEAVAGINARTDHASAPPLTPTDIPINDKVTLAALAQGDTGSVFQLESAGMRKLVKQLRPDCFADITALVALFRPGPMDLIPRFVACKHGDEQVEYPDPRVEPILKETYGIMVYQEQVMQMAQVVGGYTLGAADLLRRAMGKKKPEEMAKHRVIFRAGAEKQGITAERADNIYDQMEKFAGYGFNKSHAAAYAMLSCKTAWLKTHYPVEFFTAVLNVYSSHKKQDRLNDVINDARAHGLKVLPPDINSPALVFTQAPGGIRYGLSGLKGVSKIAVEAIIQARQTAGPFESFFDFFRKVPRAGLDKRVADALVKVGAFDTLDTDRASLLACVPDAIKYAGRYAKANAGSSGILTSTDLPGATPASGRARRTRTPKPVEEPSIVRVPSWSQSDQLVQEYAVAGFYISGHPYDVIAKSMGGLKAALPLKDVDDYVSPESQYGSLPLVAGIVTKVIEKNQSNGGKMGIVFLSDGDQERSILAFSSVFEPVASWVKPGVFLSAAAAIEPDRRNGESGNSIKADQIFSMEQTRDMLTSQVRLAITIDELPRLGEIVSKYGVNPSASNKGAPADCHPIQLGLIMPSPASPGEVICGVHRKTHLRAGQPLLVDLESAFGADRVSLRFADTIALSPQPRPSKNRQRRNP